MTVLMCHDQVEALRASLILTSEITQSEALAALADALNGQCFKDAPQTSAFLRFIVTETLAGRSNELKGYTIATLGLGRPESFDPQTDPIVRVQAGRLRQSLNDFYTANPTSAVRIMLDKGSYIPRFTRMHIAASEQSEANLSRSNETAAQLGATFSRLMGWGKGAAVAAVVICTLIAFYWARPPAQLQAVADNPQVYIPQLTVRLSDESRGAGDAAFARRISDAIARFDDIVTVQDDVLPRSGATDASSQRQGPEIIRRNLALTLSVSTAGEGYMRVAARLTDTLSNRQIWSREYGPLATDLAGDAARTRTVQSIASTIAQPYGVIHAHVRATAPQGAQSRDSYGCLIEAFDYWLINNGAAHKQARDCLLAYVAHAPNASAAHAQLAYLHLEEFRQGYNPLPGDARKRALESARNAVRARPTSARSHQALLAAHFARRELDEAWRAANEALELNPYDSEIMADIGARNVQSGNYAKGLILLQKSLEANLAPPTWAVAFRAIALYMLDRIDEAAPLAQTMEGSSYPPAMLAMVLTSYRARNVVEAQKHLAALRGLHPVIAKNLNAYLERLNFDAGTISKALESYNSAVVWIDAQERIQL